MVLLGSLAIGLVLTVIIICVFVVIWLLSVPQSWYRWFKEIPREKIEIDRNSVPLGEGSFGVVYQGRYNGQEVAVKILKEGYEKDFEDEVAMLLKVDHPNIVKLLGVCTKEKMMVFEYMNGGNLIHYTESHGELTKLDQLEILRQIVPAVSYLHGHGIIHRDIAARNILVSKIKGKATFKIADLGMSIQTENLVYKDTDPNRVLNKQMAPESIKYGIFSTCSDVWNLGVLMYELLILGASLLPLKTFTLFVRSIHLPCHIPSLNDFYAMLQKCLEKFPENRISVEGLYNLVQDSWAAAVTRVRPSHLSSWGQFPTVSAVFPQ